MKKLSAIDWLLLLMAVLGILLVIMSNRAKQNVERIITTTDTIVINDTITNLQYDTVYFNHYDTLKLPVVDTINDTVLKIDSILVQIPISTTVYDTTIKDTNYRTSLRAVVEGFAVNIDTLSIHTEITRQETILVPKQRRWGVGAGLMYGTGGFGLGVGIFYKLF